MPMRRKRHSQRKWRNGQTRRVSIYLKREASLLHSPSRIPIPPQTRPPNRTKILRRRPGIKRAKIKILRILLLLKRTKRETRVKKRRSLKPKRQSLL
jgi:hypothetical protein